MTQESINVTQNLHHDDQQISDDEHESYNKNSTSFIPIGKMGKLSNKIYKNNKLPNEPGDYMSKIDIKNAFYHIPLSPSARAFFAFNFQDIHYAFMALPFGLTTKTSNQTHSQSLWDVKLPRLHNKQREITGVASNNNQISWIQNQLTGNDHQNPKKKNIKDYLRIQENKGFTQRQKSSFESQRMELDDTIVKEKSLSIGLVGEQSKSMNGRKVNIKEPTITIYTDISKMGWGAVLNKKVI
ncbi:4259_t:CDS:2 [Gigaspora margarita]|uniref:4259_t:CDS:1 n=1 Tax=Gigaspora margarita TaxID=4874 RepID=A0ABN7UM21_GIGMA|nr:4259_t:CDS:2 [Gigaspora margarita]